MINDFAQLSDFPEVISGEALLRMTTKFYKLRDVRQHVCRLRKILANPPKKRIHQSTESDIPENKTADSAQPKTATSTKNNKGKAAAKRKTSKVVIHKTPAGPGLFRVHYGTSSSHSCESHMLNILPQSCCCRRKYSSNKPIAARRKSRS